MNTSLNIVQLITQASLAVQLIMALLAVLSLIGWVLIFHLAGKMTKTARFDARFADWLWQDDLDKQFATVQNESERTGLEAVFFAGFSQFKNSQSAQKIELAERTLATAISHDQNYLEQGLPTLASIASVSPYIGLLGTVWGIMHAFIGLGEASSVSLSVIAPSIAEALIATALGLFAAIPASLAYNFYTAKANDIYEKRSLFCQQLITKLMAESSQSSAEK